jgi:dTDP-4-amino-4,6-dideoxygalactose transaminase
LRCEDDILEYGYKFHMNDVTATIGLEQLKYLGHTIQKHQKNAAIYDGAFADLKTIRPLRYQSDRHSVYWLYTIRAHNRDLLIEHLKRAGIVASKVHVRNDRYTMFRAYATDLPGVDAFYSEQVSIPVGWWLTEKDRSHIVQTVSDFDSRFSAGELRYDRRMGTHNLALRR